MYKDREILETHIFNLILHIKSFGINDFQPVDSRLLREASTHMKFMPNMHQFTAFRSL